LLSYLRAYRELRSWKLRLRNHGSGRLVKREEVGRLNWGPTWLRRLSLLRRLRRIEHIDEHISIFVFMQFRIGFLLSFLVLVDWDVLSLHALLAFLESGVDEEDASLLQSFRLLKDLLLQVGLRKPPLLDAVLDATLSGVAELTELEGVTGFVEQC